MANLHIITCGGQLAKSSEHLVFTDYEGNSTRILPFQITQILAYMPISVTADAFTLLAKNGIGLMFKSCSGAVNIEYEAGKNVFLRHAQYKISADKKLALSTAKKIVCGKIKNQITFMQRIKRNDACYKENLKDISAIKQTLKKSQSCKSLDALRGFEGIASKYYFATFGRHIKPEWAEFTKRSKNPPLTNVNAALSFLYTLLSQEVLFACQSLGLDCMTGTLHELSYGRNSLVFDLMEEFRTPIADTLCCNLFNNGIVHAEDFETQEDGKAVYFAKQGLKKAVSAFEQKMASTITYNGAQLTMRELILSQAEAYKKYVSGEQKEYTPFIYR